MPECDILSPEESRALMDEQARRYLGMSWEEFERAWNAGEFKGREEESRVLRVATFLPLKEIDAGA